MSRTTKSATEFAKTAYDAACGVYPDHAHRFSPRKFTQPQLATILALRQFFKLDYRGVTERLREWRELRDVMGLKKIPHFTTLIHAEGRLLKKMPSPGCSTSASSRPGASVC